MAYQGWKELERRHAKRMGGKRLWRPDFGESMPDGENERETWDAKYTIHNFAIVSLFEKCEAKYRAFTGQRNFHLVLFAKKRRCVGDLVVVRADRYAELCEKEALLDSQVEAFKSVTGT